MEMPIPPLESEPEDHLDDLGGINRPELEQARINKHKELLTPDPAAAGMATLSAQMSLLEATMRDVHKDFRELIKVLKHLGEAD
jgi:hypothetical protein